MVICNILITFYLGKVSFIQKQQVEGIILKESEANYLVDFSNDAKKHDYVGDYSKKLVPKTDCVKE